MDYLMRFECPECSKGKEVPVQLVPYQINFEEAIWLCSSKDCIYPFSSPDLRKFITARPAAELASIEQVCAQKSARKPPPDAPELSESEIDSTKARKVPEVPPSDAQSNQSNPYQPPGMDRVYARKSMNELFKRVVSQKSKKPPNTQPTSPNIPSEKNVSPSSKRMYTLMASNKQPLIQEFPGYDAERESPGFPPYQPAAPSTQNRPPTSKLFESLQKLKKMAVANGTLKSPSSQEFEGFNANSGTASSLLTREQPVTPQTGLPLIDGSFYGGGLQPLTQSDIADFEPFAGPAPAPSNDVYEPYYGGLTLMTPTDVEYGQKVCWPNQATNGNEFDMVMFNDFSYDLL